MKKHNRGRRVPFAAVGAAAREDVLVAYEEIVSRADEDTEQTYVEVGDDDRKVVIDMSGEVAFKDGAALYTQIPIKDRLRILTKYGWMKSGQRAAAVRRRAGVTKQGRRAERARFWRSSGAGPDRVFYFTPERTKREVQDLFGRDRTLTPAAKPSTGDVVFIETRRGSWTRQKWGAHWTGGLRATRYVRERVWTGGVPLGKPARKKTPKRKPYYEWADAARAIEAARSAGYAPKTAAEAIEALAWNAGYEQGARGRAPETAKPAKVPPKWAKRWAKHYMVGWADGKATRT